MKKKKRSKYYQAYMKERRRLQSFARRASRRGFIIPDHYIPAIPKTITAASVRRLQRLTPKSFYEKAEYVSPLTSGEVVSAKKGLKLEKAAQKAERDRKRKLKESEKARPEGQAPKGFFDKVVISNWRETVRSFGSERVQTFLLNWLNKLIRENGLHNVAVMLEEGAQRGDIIRFETVYNMERAVQYTSNMLAYLRDQGEMYMDQMEQWSFNASLTELLEEEESWEDFD